MANPFNFDKVKNNIAQAKRELPVILAKQAESHFTDSFNAGGLDEHKWQESKRRIAGEAANMRKPKGISLNRWQTNPTLVGVTGALRRKVSRSIMGATWSKINLVVDLPYAKYHNDKDAGKTWRPFMIQTTALRKKQLEKVKEYFDRVWTK